MTAFYAVVHLRWASNTKVTANRQFPNLSVVGVIIPCVGVNNAISVSPVRLPPKEQSVAAHVGNSAVTLTALNAVRVASPVSPPITQRPGSLCMLKKHVDHKPRLGASSRQITRRAGVPRVIRLRGAVAAVSPAGAAMRTEG